MPRDSTSSPVVAEVGLSGGRRGRIIAADDAGEFAVVVNSTWIDRLHAVGRLDDAARDAAVLVLEAFEAAGIRPRLTGKYDGVTVDHADAAGSLLETLSAAEMRSWRRLGWLLARIPRQYRSQCSLVICWGHQPWNLEALRRGLHQLAKALRYHPPCG